MYQEEY